MTSLCPCQDAGPSRLRSLPDLVGRVVEGVLMKAMNHGSLSIRCRRTVHTIPEPHGSCPYRFQTPKERVHVGPESPVVPGPEGVPRNGKRHAPARNHPGQNGRGLVEGLIMKQVRESPPKKCDGQVREEDRRGLLGSRLHRADSP